MTGRFNLLCGQLPEMYINSDAEKKQRAVPLNLLMISVKKLIMNLVVKAIFIFCGGN